MTDANEVGLRRVGESDVDFLFGWLEGAPDAEWTQWDAPYLRADGLPASRADFENRFRAWPRDADRRIVTWGGRAVGMVTRHEEEPPGGGWWELGVLIFDPSCWSRGIGRQALSQWSRQTFAETDAEVLTVTTWSGNQRMIACARHAGFRECARVPRARAWDGRRWDSVKLARLRDRGEPSWRCSKEAPVPGDVARLLATVPEWFGIPEANADYVAAAGRMETWTVRDSDARVVGVVLVDYPEPGQPELHLMVVDRAWHGRGVGSALVRAVADDCRARGFRLLHVKTLGPSHPDAGYARTRAFYEKAGFLALEETDLWGPQTPCLIMVLPLTAF